jgi:folate-binding protein YgfZ
MSSTGYQAIFDGAAVGAVAPRRQLAVGGKDRASFLQGLLTNDIQALTPGTGCYAAWLSPQGRMLTDLHVLESGSMMLLDLPAEVAEATLQRLDQFLFSEEVTLGSMADALASVWLHGARAASLLEALLGTSGLDGWRDYQHAQLELEGAAVSVARIDQLGVPGYCAFLERSREAQLVSLLEAAGAVHADADAVRAARIEAVYPVFGADMTDDTIPLEAGIESRAISFDKGCYVGQEVIIRVMHRGHGRVARKLLGLQFGAPVTSGAKIFANTREIGFVTSAAVSPRSGPIALGYVHRDFLEPGTALEAEIDGTRIAGSVRARGEQPANRT